VGVDTLRVLVAGEDRGAWRRAAVPEITQAGWTGQEKAGVVDSWTNAYISRLKRPNPTPSCFRLLHFWAQGPCDGSPCKKIAL